MTDADTQAAIDALAHRIRTRDAALRDESEDAPDAEVFALEFLTKLRAQGWRPTPAKVMPLPKPADGGGGDGPPDAYRQIRAEWEASEHPNRSREDKAS